MLPKKKKKKKKRCFLSGGNFWVAPFYTEKEFVRWRKRRALKTYMKRQENNSLV